MIDIVARAQALATALHGGGVRAYADPAKAAKNRPCLLVAPPAIDWGEGSWTTPQVQWRIVALSSRDAGTLDAVQEIQTLVARADDVLDIEQAIPGRYRLNDQSPAMAAYFCTHTEIED